MVDQDRAAQAAKIIAAPGDYKVCEGCESIVKSTSLRCPSCHGYRFDDANARVIEQAAILGARDRTSVLETDLE
ncbi:MAG: hypothetical protein SGI71_03305 [Verrucomicrobiota bacterium]|nr:hypothetical protein [Verrucomicrobiota bacterium]